MRIIASDRFGRHAGTGFFIDPHGAIYTHSSVGGQACWDLTVEFRDQLYPAICLLSDPRSGLALLKIEVSNTPFLPIGKSDSLEIATPVLVIGYPADLPASPSSGIVAGIDQKVLGEFLSPAHIRTDLLVQPGEQGAPLLNLRGEVVGLISGRLSGGGTSAYALPIKAAEKLRRDFARFGEPRPGWVGATISPPPELVNDPTEVRLDQLAPDGPATRAGLRANDVLLRVGDTLIHRPSDIYEASFYLTGGDPVQVAVSRDGEEKTFSVLAVDHPVSRRGLEERRRLEEENDPGLRLPGGSKLSLEHGR